MLLLSFLLLQTLPCFAINILHIGGLFSIFNKQGDVDLAQLEHASVFLQAIDEINKNSAILPNHELRVVMGTGGTPLEVALSVNQMVGMGSSFVGGVSALDNLMGGYATKLFEDSNTMIVNSMTTDTSFGDATLYPIKAQTIPISSFQGMVYQDLLCRLNLTRVAIFTTDDLNGIRFGIELSDQTYCTMTVLGIYHFHETTTDFLDLFHQAIAVKARLFIIAVSSPLTVRYILEQGYESGLFREGTQVLLTEVHGLGTALSRLDNERVRVITKGIVSLEYYPDYSVYNTPRGLQFYNTWVNQTTLGNCSTQLDAMGNKYLHHQTSEGIVSCADLNFSSYKSGAISLDPYSPLSYDAAYTLAWGLHHAIEKGIALTGKNLTQVIIDEVDFEGASGHIDIFEGMSEYNLIGKGDREVGSFFKLMNFHYGQYLSNGIGMQPFILTNPDVGLYPCPPTLACPPPEYVFDDGWQGVYPPYAFAGAPTVVKIGGLFSAFKDGGSIMDKENAEFLAMFLMAVSEINNKTDGIHDDLLPDTQLKISLVNSISTTLSGATAYFDVKDSFFHSGVSGIVNTLSSDLVKSINPYAVEDKTFQVISTAQDADLADGLQYPYKASTIPLDTFIGAVFQEILCSNGLEKIAILAEDNSFGMQATFELMSNTRGSDCNLLSLAHISFIPTTTDFSLILDELKQSGAQIFVIFASLSPTTSLLIQGRNRRVFHSGMLILTSESHNLAEEMELTHSLDKVAISSILRGVISADFFPDYGVKYTVMGKSFMTRFLEFGASRLNSYTADCKQFDDSGERMLLRNTETGVGCAELNFSSYISGNEDLGVYASLVYDATYALAHAIHVVLSQSTPLTSSNIREAMLDDVLFEGVSGMIDIERGSNLRTGDKQGDRVGGVHYQLLNFQDQDYLLGNGSVVSSQNDGFVVIGLWSSEEGTIACPSDMICHEVVYDSPSNKIPGDSRSPIVLEFNQTTRVFFYALGWLVIAVVLLFLVLTIRYRNLAEVQNSQESLLYCILIGGFLAGGRVINSAVPLSDNTCVAGYWFGNLSFWFAMMAFFLKSWRVNRLLAIKSIKRVRITTSQIMTYMFLSVFFMVAMLVLLTIVGQPHYREVVTENSNQQTLVPYCAMVNPGTQSILYVFEAMLLGTTLRTCWSVREVPKKFSDFQTMGPGEKQTVLLNSLDLTFCSISCDCDRQCVRDANRLPLGIESSHLQCNCQWSFRSGRHHCDGDHLR
jgi:hypothetical protein